jgi:uncharacterized protein YdaU (DUF1376 family)
MHQWRTGPLPDDDRQLAAIARCDSKTWFRIGPVVRAFFSAADGGLSQARLERIRAEQGNKVSQRVKAGKASAEARKAQREGQRNANENPTSVEVSLPGSCQRQGREPEPELERDISLRSISLPRAKRAASNSHPDFADFWQAYPRKVGKGAAEKAFAAAIAKGASVGDIAAGLNRQVWPDNPRFIPHPATWLNHARWQDDPAAAAPPAAEPAGKMDWLIREMAAERSSDFPDFNAPPLRLVQ